MYFARVIQFIKNNTLFTTIKIGGGLPDWIAVERDVECTMLIGLRRLNKLARDDKAFAPR